MCFFILYDMILHISVLLSVLGYVPLLVHVPLVVYVLGSRRSVCATVLSPFCV